MKEQKDKELNQLFKTLPVISLKTLLKPNHKELQTLKRALERQQTPLPYLSLPKVNTFQVEAARQKIADVQQKMKRINAHPVVVRWYEEKLSEYQEKVDIVEAAQKKDNQAIGLISQKLFGAVTVSAETYHSILVNRVPQKAIGKKDDRVDASLFAAMAREKLDAIGGHDWVIKIMKRERLQISYKRIGSSVLRIPKELSISKKRAQEMLRHEIEAHAQRTIHGQNSDYAILGQGLAKYKRTEEGLATHLQQSKLGGVWDGYTASLRKEKNLQEAYNAILAEKLRYYKVLKVHNPLVRAQKSTWRLLKRTLNGIQNPNQVGAAYFRSHIYFEGKVEVEKALNEKRVTLSELFLGNIGLQHIEDARKLLEA